MFSDLFLTGKVGFFTKIFNEGERRYFITFEAEDSITGEKINFVIPKQLLHNILIDSARLEERGFKEFDPIGMKYVRYPLIQSNEYLEGKR